MPYALFKDGVARIFWSISGLFVLMFYLPPALIIFFIGILSDAINWLDMKLLPLEWKLNKMYKSQEEFRRKLYNKIGK